MPGSEFPECSSPKLLSCPIPLLSGPVPPLAPPRGSAPRWAGSWAQCSWASRSLGVSSKPTGNECEWERGLGLWSRSIVISRSSIGGALHRAARFRHVWLYVDIDAVSSRPNQGKCARGCAEGARMRRTVPDAHRSRIPGRIHRFGRPVDMLSTLRPGRVRRSRT